MSLGSFFRRVASWRKDQQKISVSEQIERLKERDVSDPTVPLEFAKFWRDLTPSVFTAIPVAEQICYPVVRNHESLEELANLLDKTLRLIAEDDYEHLAGYLKRRLETKHDNSLAGYLTDKDGYPLDAVALYTRVCTLLFSLAATLDGMESFEYHRLANHIYGELLNVVARLLEYEQR
jgi:hypothetical protein